MLINAHCAPSVRRCSGPGKIWGDLEKSSKNWRNWEKPGNTRFRHDCWVTRPLHRLKGHFSMQAAQSLTESFLEHSKDLSTPTSFRYVANNRCLEIRSLSQNRRQENSPASQKIRVRFLPSQQHYIIFPATWPVQFFNRRKLLGLQRLFTPPALLWTLPTWKDQRDLCSILRVYIWGFPQGENKERFWGFLQGENWGFPQGENRVSLRKPSILRVLLSLPFWPLKIACHNFSPHKGAFDMLNILELTCPEGNASARVSLRKPSILRVSARRKQRKLTIASYLCFQALKLTVQILMLWHNCV